MSDDRGGTARTRRRRLVFLWAGFVALLVLHLDAWRPQRAVVHFVEGTYILRSNLAEWTEQELWQTYIQLSQAEADFRIHKSDLRIRPIWHQKQERVQAHILVCFLAFAMWKTLEGWQSRAGLGNSPRTILEEMGRIHAVDVVLPLVDGPELRLRCVAQPDGTQAALLERLGLSLPKRLRRPDVAEI